MRRNQLAENKQFALSSFKSIQIRERANGFIKLISVRRRHIAQRGSAPSYKMDIIQRVALSLLLVIASERCRNKEIESEGLFLERFAPLCAQRWWYNNNNNARQPPPLAWIESVCATPTPFFPFSYYQLAHTAPREKERELQHTIYYIYPSAQVHSNEANSIKNQCSTGVLSTPYLRKYYMLHFISHSIGNYALVVFMHQACFFLISINYDRNLSHLYAKYYKKLQHKMHHPNSLALLSIL